MSILAEEERLLEMAKRARETAFAPYSNFKVGAVIETSDGRLFTGCNIESASYGLTVCAERVALWKAISEGARAFQRIAIVAETEKLTTPCGACRQLLWEFAGDCVVLLSNLRGEVFKMTVGELLPRAFDAEFLSEKMN